MADRGKRAGGRAARVAARKSDEKQFYPAAPGQIGGQYKPLTDHDLQSILDTAYKILDEIGFSEVPAIVMEKALGRGLHQR